MIASTAGSWPTSDGLDHESLRAAQCHGRRYMAPLMKRILAGEIDPKFVITHRMALGDAPRGYVMFRNKQDNYEKVVLSP